MEIVSFLFSLQCFKFNCLIMEILADWRLKLLRPPLVRSSVRSSPIKRQRPFAARAAVGLSRPRQQLSFFLHFPPPLSAPHSRSVGHRVASQESGRGDRALSLSSPKWRLKVRSNTTSTTPKISRLHAIIRASFPFRRSCSIILFLSALFH